MANTGKKTMDMKKFFSKFTPEQQKEIARTMSNGQGSKKPVTKAGAAAKKK